MRVGWRGPLRDHEARSLGEKHLQLVRHVPKGGTWRDIPPHLLPERFQGGMRRTDSTNLLGRLDPDRPAYTITTQFNNVTAGCFTHLSEDRALSVRARLQSFRDSFEFVGTQSSRCRQIGNAVPPLLAQHLAYALAKTIAPGTKPRRPKKVISVLTPPTPVPDEASRTRMVRQPRQNTKPENRLFETLGERGIEFARNVEPVEGLRREVDGCLAKEKIAVFVDGCFWHGCPIHSRPTKSNTLWWREKIDRNKARDSETDTTLRSRVPFQRTPPSRSPDVEQPELQEATEGAVGTLSEALKVEKESRTSQSRRRHSCTSRKVGRCSAPRANDSDSISWPEGRPRPRTWR